MNFVAQDRSNLKHRILLLGPSKAGKSYGALVIATAMIQKYATDKRVAVFDTENNATGALTPEFSFDVWKDNYKRFPPSLVGKFLQDAAKTHGVAVIDGMASFWMGPGGTLEIVENAAKNKFGGNTVAGWAVGTPEQNNMVTAIQSCDLHVITTCLGKIKTKIVKNKKTGKSDVIQTPGIVPEQRQNFPSIFNTIITCEYDAERKLHTADFESHFSEVQGLHVENFGVEWITNNLLTTI